MLDITTIVSSAIEVVTIHSIPVQEFDKYNQALSDLKQIEQIVKNS